MAIPEAGMMVMNAYSAMCDTSASFPSIGPVPAAANENDNDGQVRKWEDSFHK